MREFDFKDCLSNIRFIEGIVDQTWLKTETEKITTHKAPKDLRKLSFLDNEVNIFHPLAYLIYIVEKQLNKCAQDKYFEITEEITKLSLLGEAAFFIKEIKCSWLRQ